MCTVGSIYSRSPVLAFFAGGRILLVEQQQYVAVVLAIVLDTKNFCLTYVTHAMVPGIDVYTGIRGTAASAKVFLRGTAVCMYE